MGTNGRWFLTGLAGWIMVAISGCGVATEDPRTRDAGQMLDYALDAPPPTDPPGAVMCGEDTVDETGGTVTARRDHRFEVPAGQPGSVRVRISELPTDYVGARVRVQPGNHVFNPQATLTISFDHCPPDVTGPFKIYRWNGTTWERLEESQPSTQLPRAVEVKRTSASDYALGSA